MNAAAGPPRPAVGLRASESAMHVFIRRPEHRRERGEPPVVAGVGQDQHLTRDGRGCGADARDRGSGPVHRAERAEPLAVNGGCPAPSVPAWAKNARNLFPDEVRPV